MRLDLQRPPALPCPIYQFGKSSPKRKLWKAPLPSGLISVLWARSICLPEGKADLGSTKLVKQEES